jgi:hypothetical protein
VEEREAMEWVSHNTPQHSRFLVVTSERWPVDRSSEWFPVLAQRVSVATVQGAEWLPNGEFARRVEGNDELRTCAVDGVDCLKRWILGHGVEVTLVYVPKRHATLHSAALYRGTEVPEDCCRTLRDELTADPRYLIAYDNPGVTVFWRNEAAGAANRK